MGGAWPNLQRLGPRYGLVCHSRLTNGRLNNAFKGTLAKKEKVSIIAQPARTVWTLDTSKALFDVPMAITDMQLAMPPINIARLNRSL